MSTTFVRTLQTFAFTILLPAASLVLAAGENVFDDGLEGGLACSAQAPPTAIINVRSAIVRPMFLHNGSPFEANPAQSGTFHLVPRAGEPILLGTSFEPPGSGVRVVSDVYDVEYRWRAGDRVPRNVAARVLQGVLIAGDRDLVIDVPSASLRGNLRMNGAPFPQAGVNAATLSLEGVHALGRVVLGSSNQSTYATRLIPGAYDLRYQTNGIGGPIPSNQDAMRERHDIERDTATRDFDIPAVLAQFLFRANGVPFPDNALENGVVSLRRDSGDRIELGHSRNQTRTVRLIPGEYDGYWEGLTGSSVVPANPDSRFRRGLLVTAGVSVLDVPSISISGDFLVNGETAPISETERGQVWLRDVLTSSEVQLGSTTIGSFQRRVIPARYDVVYSRQTGGNIMPANGDVVIESARDFAAQADADIDIPSTRLEYQLTLNGATFFDTQTENGRLTTRSGADAADIQLGQTIFLGDDGDSVLLVPGEYDVTYSQLTGSLMPNNTRATLDPFYVVLNGGVGTQTLDVRTGEYAFAFRNNGAPFADDPARSAAFELRHLDDVVAIGTTRVPAPPRILIGNVRPLSDGRTATVHYTWQTGDPTEMPRNVDHPVACFVLNVP